MSLRAYAKRRGVSAEAVSKAVADGRLRDAVVIVGRAPKIADPDLADREWGENTRAPAAGPRAAAPRDLPEYFVSRSARETSAARREAAQAELAEIELAEKRGQLVSAEEARSGVLAAFSLVKTRLLGVPSQVGHDLPEIADTVVPVVDKLIREALEELQARGSAGTGDE